LSTARHAATPAATPFVVVLFRLLKHVFTRRRSPVTPIDEFLVEEFTPSQVASMDANNRRAMKFIFLAVVVAAVAIAIYLIAIRHFVNAELGPMFDQLMKPLPGTPR
jgi:peptidoglycan/LPS O-acetylase OafA/YrhL